LIGNQGNISGLDIYLDSTKNTNADRVKYD